MFTISSEAISHMKISKGCLSTSIGGNEKKLLSALKEKSCFYATSIGGNEKKLLSSTKRENQKKPRGCF